MADRSNGPNGGFILYCVSGTLLWSPKTGMHETNGDIDAKYTRYGGPWGPLGYPTSDEGSFINMRGGKVYTSYFQGGYIWLVADGHKWLVWAYRNNPQGGVALESP